MGLTATKIVTSKRIEFFREAGSGYNLNAYFVAITCFSTVEHSVQAIIAAFFAFWIRNPLASATSFFVHFVLLAWVTAGWGLLIPMVTPQDSIVLVAGFFFSFCGLLFSGANSPVLYKDIYEQGGFLEVFAGWIAPTRFFFEALTVGEYRCLPEQSGFTIETEAINRSFNTSAFFILGYAGNDHTVTERSCDGWYWSVVPVVLVGITVRFAALGAMHGFSRAQQTKKPLLYTMRRDNSLAVSVVVYSVVLAALFGVTTWLMVREVPYVENEPSRDNLIDRYLN
jgi:type IV secretory pathway TrbD component